jgi:hypothetical protein
MDCLDDVTVQTIPTDSTTSFETPKKSSSRRTIVDPWSPPLETTPQSYDPGNGLVVNRTLVRGEGDPIQANAVMLGQFSLEQEELLLKAVHDNGKRWSHIFET